MYNGRHPQAVGEAHGYGAGSDIDGKMAAPGKWIETQIAKRLGKAMAGMIADQQNRQLGQWVEHPEGPGFFGR